MKAWYSSFLSRPARSLTWVGILIALGISLLALIGAVLDIRLLTSVRPEWFRMSVITATCLVFSALELALLYKNPSRVRKFVVLQIPGILDILVGSLTIVLYTVAMTTGWEPPLRGAGLLNLFWNPETRLALMTAIVFVLIGCALVLLTGDCRRASNIAHTLMLPALVMSYLVPVSYLFGIQNVYAWLGIPMSINTGVALCSLSVAIFCTHPDTWMMRVFTADHAGSIMARRLLPILLLIPLLIGWLKLYGVRSGAFVSDAEVSIVAVAYTFCLLCIVWLTAASLNRVDAQRRQGEEAVRESEARLKVAEAVKEERQRFFEVLDTLPTMICLLKPDYRVAFANRSFRDKFGEAHGRPCYEYRFGGSEPCGFCETTEVLKTGRSHHWEFTGPDSSVIDSYDFPFTDVDGSPMILEMDIDITERRRTERTLIEIKENLEQRVAERTAELAASEELLKQSQEIAHLGSWELDLVSNHLSWTDEVYRIFGLKPREFDATYEAFLEAVHPDDRVAVDTAYSGSVREGRDTYEIEHRVIRKSDGEVRIVHEKCNHFRDESGRIIRSVGMVHDITERKRAEEAHKESEEKYRALFDHMNEIVAVDELLFDEQGNASDWRLLDVNPAYLRAVGRPLTDIVGQCSSEVYGDRVQESFLRHFTHIVRTGEPVQFEQYFEPTRMHLLVSAFHLGGARLATVTTDITKRKSMEEALRKSRDELELRVEERTEELKTYMAKLEESNQALQDFASIASHDMQEPLRKVVSFGNILRQTYKEALGETGIDYLNRMIGATNRMQSLLKGLLEYSRVTSKADPFVDVELTKIIGEVLCDLEVRIERTGGKVLIGELPVIKGDPTQMRQLFQNLIGNGLKFHKVGENPVIKMLSAITDNGELQIVVEDNGIGFEEKYIDRIFAPFQRLHGRGSPYEGTGMGLAICKKIVERHGGTIRAESEPGKGSTFIISLP
jgi:PAS domain S-box-containing protein